MYSVYVLHNIIEQDECFANSIYSSSGLKNSLLAKFINSYWQMQNQILYKTWVELRM